jgi:hypothetical protein
MRKIYVIITFAACLLLVNSVHSQTTHILNNRGGGDFLGWSSGSTGSLDIRNDFNDVINFKTNTNLQATLDALGNFSIGLNLTTNYFGINNTPVLWHNGNVEDIFVGVGAGNNFMNHHSHVCVGHLSGTRITIGDSLTFVGYESGTTNDTGSYNTAVGCRALFSNRSASNNVAIGNNALHSLVMWTDDGGGHESENTAVGVDALHDNVAYGACALGYQAGQYNTTGCSLVAIGEQAAQSSLHGNNNMAIGEVALRHNAYLSENVALGKWALEWMDFNPGSSDACVNGNGFTVHGCVNSFNVAVGNGALRYTNPGSLTSGVLNNGKNNTAIGDHAGANNITGYDNLFMGFTADVCASCTGIHNAAAIGANTEVKNSNQMILGNNSVNVGIGLSGNATGPTNKLEIRQGTAGNSGLTFTSLTDAATPVGNTGLGVLAVNNTGKVVYVDNTGLGNYCGATPSNPLKADYEIPLNRHNYYFIGQDIATSDVIVGESSCVNPSPSARMYVHQATTQSYPASFAGEFLNSTDENLAVGVIGIALQSEYNNIGTVGLSTQSRGVSNVGVYGSVNGMAALLGGATNFGVYGFTNTPTHGFVNFAVVGDLGPHIAFPSAPDYAGYFNGDVLSTTGVYATSDSTLKDNIQNINNPISIIKSLKPKSYTFKRQQFESMQLPDGTHYGILAQDLQNVYQML